MWRRLQVARGLRARSEHVAEVLRRDPVGVLGTPAGPPGRYHTEIVVDLGAGSSVHQVVAVELGPLVSTPTGLRAELSWTPVGRNLVLPAFAGALEVAAVGDATQVRVTGCYHAPLGPLGAVGDAIAGRRVAQQSLVRFTENVVRSIDAAVDRLLVGATRPAPYPDDLRPRVREG
jgi:hypothetical protein